METRKDYLSRPQTVDSLNNSRNNHNNHNHNNLNNHNHNNLNNIIDISAGLDHNLALLSNGRVTGWGDNTHNQSLGGSGLVNVQSISAGGSHSLAIINNKNVGFLYHIV
jgi:alpha-tubulin suppressor-like RCC1 family protein